MNDYKGVVIRKYDAYKKRTGAGNSKTRVHRTQLIVDAAECLLCGDILFSRCRHDMRSCSCENTTVDGGLTMFKFAWQVRKPKTYKLSIIQNKHELYDDWNTSTNRFGLVTLKEYKQFGLQSKGYGRLTEGAAGKKKPGG